MSRRAILLSVLLLLLVGLLIVGYSQLEFIEEEETIHFGLRGEAAKKPLLAAERFLLRMGIAAKTLDNSSRLLQQLGSNDVLLMTSNRQTLGPIHSQQLLDWVQAGGRLVITLPHQAIRDLQDEIEEARDDDDPDWEFTQKPRLRDHILDTLALEAHYDNELRRCEIETTQIDVEDTDNFLEIDFNPRFYLNGANEDDLVIDHQNGDAFVRRELGKGMVTVISDLNFLTYRNIGDYDHAEFLWYIVNGEGKVWMVTQNDMPSILAWLWQNANEIMVASLLLLLIWLWSRAPRFGPLVAEAPPVRRRILEHILASGRFMWQHQQQARLLRAVRQELLDTAARRHPAWVGMTTNERTMHVANITGLNTDAAHRLLNGEDVQQRQEFTRLIRQLEHIRKKL